MTFIPEPVTLKPEDSSLKSQVLSNFPKHHDLFAVRNHSQNDSYLNKFGGLLGLETYSHSRWLDSLFMSAY
jgi:hypothetical protein